jgi:hypothetical protein
VKALGSARISEPVASEHVAVYTEVVHSLYPFLWAGRRGVSTSCGAAFVSAYTTLYDIS